MTIKLSNQLANDSKRIPKNFYFVGLLLSGISFRIIGDVYVGEIILSILAIHRFLKREKYTAPKIWRILLIAGIIWTFANLIGSIHSSKSFEVTLISVFTPILTLSCLSTCHYFMNQNESLFFKSIFLFALGRFIGIVVDPLPYTETYPWKFGYGEATILLFIVVSYYLRIGKLQILGGIALCVISFINQARTLAFMTFVSILAVLPSSRNRKNQSFLIIIGILLPIAYWIYIDLAVSGVLGVKEISRARLLTATDLGPLAARKEIVFSFRAFMESPFFGYGFYPNVNTQVIISGYQFWADQGYPIYNYDPSKMPLHSFIWSAVIQGGIFAGGFWAISILFAMNTILRIMDYRPEIRVVIMYSAVAIIDRILFSPFGAYERLFVAIFMGNLIVVSGKKEFKANHVQE